MNIAATHLLNEVRGCGFDTAKTDPNKGIPLFSFRFPQNTVQNKGILFCCSHSSTRQKQKNAAPPFPVRHRLCTLFHHFSFLPPLFVLTLTALYILKFPNEFFVFFRARVRQPLRRGHKIYEFRFGAVLYTAEPDADQSFFPYPFVDALRAVSDKFQQVCPLRVEPPPCL